MLLLALITFISVEPKPIRLVKSAATAMFLFSKHGVTFAIKMSPSEK